MALTTELSYFTLRRYQSSWSAQNVVEEIMKPRQNPTFEEGTSAAWLYDLLKPHVTKVSFIKDAINGDSGEAEGS